MIVANPWDIYKNQYPIRKINTTTGEILETTENGEIVIGYTTAKYSELEQVATQALDKADQFYNRLVELGDIVPEKTQEEKMLDMMQQMQQAMFAMNAELQELKGANNGLKNNGVKESCGEIHATQRNIASGEPATEVPEKPKRTKAGDK